MSEDSRRPRRVPDIDIHEVVDGFVVYHQSRDRVHFLNATAAYVLDLCTGENDAPEIVHQLQATFELPQPPTTEIEECLSQFYAEGLVC